MGVVVDAAGAEVYLDRVSSCIGVGARWKESRVQGVGGRRIDGRDEL